VPDGFARCVSGEVREWQVPLAATIHHFHFLPVPPACFRLMAMPPPACPCCHLRLPPPAHAAPPTACLPVGWARRGVGHCAGLCGVWRRRGGKGKEGCWLEGRGNKVSGMAQAGAMPLKPDILFRLYLPSRHVARYADYAFFSSFADVMFSASPDVRHFAAFRLSFLRSSRCLLPPRYHIFVAPHRHFCCCLILICPAIC